MRPLFFRLSPALLAAALLAPRVAAACGGTFCDRPVPTPAVPNPPTMPVDQTGENILFVMNGQQVEAHVQIQYTGDPEKFAWIVPVQSEPTSITPGSQPLFSSMASATVPRLRQATQTQFDSCGSSSGVSRGSFGCAASDSGDASTSGLDLSPTQGNSGASGDRGIEVKQKVVGAYETATLKGGTADELINWLTENNYDVPENTAALLTSYLQNKYVFVAIKLVAGAGLDEIHPIVFTYPGDQPCIPIKLTAVAAVNDMAIRAFFLATDRFVPRNYKHVILNDARFDWIAPFLNQGVTPAPSNPNASPAAAGPSIDTSGYKLAVSRAVDSPVANGHAFVTEYAGPSNRVNRTSIWSQSWLSSPLAMAKPEQIPALLRSQGMLDCTTGGVCTSPYPITLLLLRKYLPAPASKTEAEYYNSPASIAQQTQSDAAISAKFANDYEAMVVAPSRHAFDVLAAQPLLTRLFTTLSPAEMTEDPEFRRYPSAPVVDNTALTATPRQACDGRTTRMLPSGREVLVTDSAGATASWPQFSDDMPWAERIEDFSQGGAPITLVDNHDAIDAALERHHQARSWPPTPGFTFVDYGGCSYERGTRSNVARVFLSLSLLALGVRRLAGSRRKK